jgi:hypothetical protein
VFNITYVLIHYWYYKMAVWIKYHCRCGLVIRVPGYRSRDPEILVQFPALPDFLRSSGLERGPLSLVSTIEELVKEKVAAPV